MGVVEYAILLSWIWWAPVWTLFLNSDSMNIEFTVITPLFLDIYLLHTCMLDTCICTLADTGHPDSVLHLLTAILLAEHVGVQTCLPFLLHSQTGKSPLDLWHFWKEFHLKLSFQNT